MNLPTTAERIAALSKYDEHAWVRKRLQRADDDYHMQARAYIDGIPTASAVLELGTLGGAFIRAYLRPRFPDARIVGVDLMPGALRHARNAGGAEYMSADIDRPLPFPDRSFDLVVGTGIIEHLYRPEMCLDEVRRVLSPGGRAVFTVPIDRHAYSADHHTFLSTEQWLSLFGRFLSVQKWHVTGAGRRLIVYAVHRGPSDRKIAFALYSFNRPHYLRDCIDSIDAAENKEGIDFYHFQDGDQCAVNKKSNKAQDEVDSCLQIAREAGTSFNIIAAPYNYGVAVQQMKSTELLFDSQKYDVLIGLVDDYVIGKHFFTVTKAIVDQFYWCPRVFSTIHTCYVRKSRAYKEQRLYKYGVTKMMTPPGGWSVYRDRWQQVKDEYLVYYDLIKTMRYTSRNHRKIREAFGYPATSHDMGFGYALGKTNLFNILPCTPRVIDIGVTGMHKRPHIHQESLDSLCLDEFEQDAQPETFTIVHTGLPAWVKAHEIQKNV
jgi:SAM-dependent methyltransferase